MFYEHLNVHNGDETHPLGLYVSSSERLPMVFQFWAAELSRDVLRLGVYFRAVAIMLQIPGAAEYEWARDEQKPDTCELVAASDDNTLHNVLGECLKRLDAEQLTEQLPIPKYRREKLSADWRAMLDRREEVANGLLSVAAECLDRLIVEPGMREIDTDGEPYWWQRFRVKMCPR
jgi:hypothetical protein